MNNSLVRIYIRMYKKVMPVLLLLGLLVGVIVTLDDYIRKEFVYEHYYIKSDSPIVASALYRSAVYLEKYIAGDTALSFLLPGQRKAFLDDMKMISPGCHEVLLIQIEEKKGIAEIYWNGRTYFVLSKTLQKEACDL